MNRIKIFLTIIIGILLAGNIFLGYGLFRAQKEIWQMHQQSQLKVRVLSFANIFIAKVLRAQGEISFNDRLIIENAVRDTQDKDIYNQWEKFVGAKNEAEGQQGIKDLLQLIISKLSQ